MRTFAALVPPDGAVDDLDSFIAPRRSADPTLRWTLPYQWHVTLAFYPEVDDRHYDDLVERLETAAARRRPMGLTIEGGGAFPDPHRAKVLFGALTPESEDDAEEVRRIAVGCRSAGVKAGVVVDGAGFHPHVTLARLGRPANVTRWLTVLDAYSGPTWVAGRVALIRSRLGAGHHGHPAYDVLEEFPIGVPDPGFHLRRHPEA